MVTNSLRAALFQIVYEKKSQENFFGAEMKKKMVIIILQLRLKFLFVWKLADTEIQIFSQKK